MIVISISYVDQIDMAPYRFHTFLPVRLFEC